MSNNTTSPFLPPSDWERNFYLFHVTAVVNAFISVICALLVCCVFLFSPVLRSGQIFRAVFYLSLTDFVWVFIHGFDHFHSLLNYSDVPFESLYRDQACEFIGWVVQSSIMGNALWVLVISFMIFLQTRSISKSTLQIPFWAYHVFVWGITFSDSFLLLILGQYGQSNPFWCHTKDNNAFLFSWTIPCTIVIAIVTCLYLFLFYEFLTLRSQTADSMKENISVILRRLVLYPLVFVVVWTPYLAWNLYLYKHPDADIPIFLTWSVIFFTNLSGILNSVAYFLTSKVVRSEFLKLLGWMLRIDKDSSATVSKSLEPYSTSDSHFEEAKLNFNVH